MKFITLLFLFLFSFLSFAQEIESRYLSAAHGNYGRDFSQKLSRTEEVLKLAEEVAEKYGVNTKRVSLKNREGKSYSALEISTSGGSLQNKEALRVSRSMFGLSLILSPFDLSSGSNAFFDPNGSKIGVPYEFIMENGIDNSSYLHELYHAGSYQKVLSGKSAPWAGLTKVLKGTYLSSKNKNYYFRFGAVDEIVATSLSLKLDALRLLELQRILPPADFYRSRGEADQILNEVYFSSLIGAALSRQTVDLVDRALSQLGSVQNQSMKLNLGRTSKNINESLFILDSYNWEIVRGHGAAVPEAEGTYFSLYSARKPTNSELKSRLELIKSLAQRSESLFVDIEKSIYVLIEYPDLKKTDIARMQRLSGRPFDLLNR